MLAAVVEKSPQLLMHMLERTYIHQGVPAGGDTAACGVFTPHDMVLLEGGHQV